MSSRDLSRVIELSWKAFALQDKEHHARAAEKLVSAIAAAQELAQKDCLVVTHLQIMHVGTLRQYRVASGVAAEAACAAEEQEAQTRLSVIAALERRRAAGTLLPGTCRSWPEEEWYGQFIQHPKLLGKFPAYASNQLADLVQFVGYDAYLFAASDAVIACLYEKRPDSDVLALAGRFAVRGLDLFEQPRVKISLLRSLASEDRMINCMGLFLEKWGPVVEERGLDHVPAPIRELLSRWQRFASSAVLQERDVIAEAAHALSVASAHGAAVRARLAAAQATLRCCSLHSCGARELHPGHYKQCGACHGAAYCCREHQLEDWPAHKAACKAARKAAAAEAGGAA